MASEWVKILGALYKCAKEIGYTCLTSVGGKLMSFPPKRMASNFLRRIGMNTRASILESRLIGSSSHCRRNGPTILLTDWRGRSPRTHGNFLLASEHLRIPLAPRHLDYPRIVLANLPCRPPRVHVFRNRPRTIWRTGSSLAF